jgi:hypothetical protein
MPFRPPEVIGSYAIYFQQIEAERPPLALPEWKRNGRTCAILT